ncbi:Phage Mu protein F like protein [anaerobic digester metagenome]
MRDPQAQAVFKQPFAEQIAFFRQKLGNLVPTARWDDLWKSQHDRGFMVAGAAKADLLADFASAVSSAIAEGKSIDWFRKNFDTIVARHGWAYRGERNWRSRVIFQTNVATSYAAGRLAQLREFPLWIYHHADGVIHPRPHHVKLDGLILPAEHPFWKKHYPPNGWGCHCYVSGASSDKAARSLGGDPAKRLPDDWDAIDASTGEPVGIDKGWGYQPGETTADIVRQMASKTVQWEYSLAKAYMQEVPASVRDMLATAYRDLPEVRADLRRYAARIIDGRAELDIPQYKTLGLLTNSDAETVRDLTGHAVTGFDFALDRSAIGHVQRKHGGASESARGQIPVVASDYEVLAQILNSPDRVEHGGVSDVGLDVVRFMRVVGAVEYVAAFELRGGRKMLVLQSMWKRPAPETQRP